MIPEKVYDILVNIFPMIILFSLVMIIIKLISWIFGGQKINFYKDIKNLIYIIYCFILFKLVTTSDFESYSNNFIPFKEIARYKITSVLFYRNVIGNIALFIPFGYLITDMIKDSIKKMNMFITIITCMLTSISIEVIQMFIGRSFDIDDIILNFIGGMIGYTLYRILHKIYSYFPKKLQNNFVKGTLFIMMIVLFILLFFIYYEVTR